MMVEDEILNSAFFIKKSRRQATREAEDKDLEVINFQRRGHGSTGIASIGSLQSTLSDYSQLGLLIYALISSSLKVGKMWSINIIVVRKSILNLM